MIIIEATPKSQIYDAKDYASHVVYKYENVLPFTIKKVNGMWRVEGTEISKLFKMTKFTTITTREWHPMQMMILKLKVMSLSLKIRKYD